MQSDVKVIKLKKEAILPAYANEFAAGADLYALCDGEIILPPHTTTVIGTGIAIELPAGYVGLIYARSGLATKKGLAPANKVGVIDCDYRGEIKVALFNHGDCEQKISCGERVAQLVITPYIKANFLESDSLSSTERGAGGFGSTGK